MGWYINDEIHSCYHELLRNRTLTIHQLDKDHPSYTVTNRSFDTNFLSNTTDMIGLDKYPVGIMPIRKVYELNRDTYYNILGSKPMFPVAQLMDWAAMFWGKYNKPDFKSAPPTIQEIKSMSWQAFIAGAKGIFYYSMGMLYEMDYVTPFEERWNDFTVVSEEIWKYKDMILSIEEANSIEYIENPNVAFKQWKYNDSNYIVIANLERTNEIFEIKLFGDYDLYKEFGLGKYKKKGKQIIFELEPIDVFMIKYINKSFTKASFAIISIIVIIIIMAIILGFFYFKNYLKQKKQDKVFIDEKNKLIN